MKNKASEKALELVAWFSNLTDHMTWEQSKECAIKCCDEIMSVSKTYAGKDYDFQNKVKEEIGKL